MSSATLDLARVEKIMSRKQIRSIVESEHARINIWHGAVSSGKTIASLLAFLFAVIRAPENGLIFVVGRSLQTVERNVIEVLMQPMGPFGVFARYVSHTRGSTVATVFGRIVHLVGASDIRAEGRIRGATAALIYIDEATLIPEAFFTMCLSRLRVPGARMLATTNPDGPMHWLRQKFLLRQDLNMCQWHFTLHDNPFLTEEYKRDLMNEYTGLFYRRFILGEWCLAEGAIYSSWNPDTMVVPDAQLPQIIDWVGVGIDYGTVNPFAAEMLGLGVDGRLYITNEYYYNSKISHREKTEAHYIADLLDWTARIPIPHGNGLLGVAPKWWVVDPSAAHFRVAMLEKGIATAAADNAVMPGIRLMSSLMATDRFRVAASCHGLINEIPAYSWDPKAAENGEDAPIKVADHGCDAGRYILRTTEAVWRTRLREPKLLALQ